MGIGGVILSLLILLIVYTLVGIVVYRRTRNPILVFSSIWFCFALFIISYYFVFNTLLNQ